MAKTNSGLLAYAKAQVGKPYWYGTFGQTASASLHASKRKQYPTYYTASDFPAQYGKRVHDCVGLVKGYLWSDNATAEPKYIHTQDVSAKGMYSAAATKGKIDTFPGKAGQLVFKGSTANKISHVGVYDGNGHVYEAKGHAYGVVKTAFKASEWPFWAQCPYTVDDTTTSNTTGKKATDSAKSFLKSLAGTYKVTASSLNIRNGAGIAKKVMVSIPKGTAVKCYGYYTSLLGVKWLYVQFTYKGVTYTGFASSKYLAK